MTSFMVLSVWMKGKNHKRFQEIALYGATSSNAKWGNDIYAGVHRKGSVALEQVRRWPLDDHEDKPQPRQRTSEEDQLYGVEPAGAL